MDQHNSGARKGTRKGSRKDCEGLWDWNLKSNRIHFSPGWISLVGCQDHEVGNTPEDWFQRVHPEDSERLQQDVDAARAKGVCDFDLRYRMRHKDGTYRWMSSRGLVVRNDAGDAVRLTGSQVDVTVETVTDPQTGLPNRLLLLERLTRSIERARRHSSFHFALLLIDLGRPASASRKPGRAMADPLLNAAARRLETCLRRPDLLPGLRQQDLVARVRDDEFAILLDGLKDLSHAKDAADQILAEMLQPFTQGGQQTRLTPAIGIVVSATGYAHADPALRDAEAALHRAQMLGGSHCALFDADALKSEEADQQLEGDFELALQRREFELLFEPIISLASNQIVGFEALVRWQHPTLGTVRPDDFITIAERTGFIVPLGEWILREACLRLASWQAGLPIRKDLWIAVNISGLQLHHPAFVEHIEAALGDAGLPPTSLVLELTEGMALDNPAAVTTLLMRLRAMGVRISIDDFGTGYSSLAYLRQFPVDTLKIDRSFIRGMEIDKDREAIVGSMIAMAQQLGLHVVAEGIENEDQLAVLRSLRCESVQGHLFAKPLDAGGAADLLREGLPARQERSRGEAAAGVLARARSHRAWHGRGLSTAGRALAIAVIVLAGLASAGLAALFDERREAVPEPPSPPRAAAATSAPTTAPRTAPAPPAVPEAAPPKSFEVVHLHRAGSCKGHLLVSRAGLSFVPDRKASSDAFTLKHSEYAHSLSASTLTIRSDERTYRFMGDGKTSQLRDVVETLAQSRPR
jgi:diguanylate cyclase (GGDEF)-like protein